MFEDAHSIENDLNSLLKYLDTFHINSKQDPGTLSRMIDNIKLKREIMLKNYSKKELELFNPDMESYIKQICKSFDNIVEQNKTEISKTISGIKNLENKKKLVNYQR